MVLGLRVASFIFGSAGFEFELLGVGFWDFGPKGLRIQAWTSRAEPKRSGVRTLSLRPLFSRTLPKNPLDPIDMIKGS